MTQLLCDEVHLAGNRPKQLLYNGACAQVDEPQAEAVEGLLAYLQGVVPVFKQACLVDLVPYLIQVLHQVVVVVFYLVGLLVPLWQPCCLQHFHHEHRVVGSEAAAAFVYDVGMLEPVLVAHVDKGVDGIVHIFLYRVVHRVPGGAVVTAVVVHAQAAAYVDKVDVEAHRRELHIELRGLAQGVLDAAYLGHLAAYVEVYELEASCHVVRLHEVERLKELTRVEAKLAAVAAALFPLAAAAARELDAYAYVGHDVELLGHIGNQVQLVEFLHHQEDAPPHLLGQQGQLDVFAVFVAVAYDERVVVHVGHVDGQHGVQLGLGSGLEPYLEFLAVTHDFLHHGSHLIHLDGVDHKVLPVVVVLLGCLLEATRYLLDAVVEYVGKSQQYGRGDVARVQVVHHVHQVDGHTVFFGCNGDMTVLVD